MPKKAASKKKKAGASLKRQIVYLCSCCSLIVLLFLTSFNINSFLSEPPVLGAETEQGPTLEDQEKYWEEFLSKNPTYLDGWLELARIEHKSGNVNYALGAFNTAKAISPNNQKVKELGNLLLSGR